MVVGHDRRLVLSIEDQEAVREVLLLILDGEGYETIYAEDGAKALQLLKKRTPDLVLLDLTLPDISGILLLDVIRSNDSLSHIPVILLTGNGTPETKVTGLARGAVDYVTKPFDAKDLMARIRAHIQRKDAEERARHAAARLAEATQQSLRKAEQRFTALVRNSFDLVCELDASLGIEYVSPNHNSILGYPEEALVSKSWLSLVHPDELAAAEETLRGLLSSSSSVRMTVRFRDMRGGWLWLDVSGGLQNPEDPARKILLVSRDITQIKETEMQLEHSALHDSLTGLGNRKLFSERLEELLANKQACEKAAVFCLDVDNFKVINDTQGHAVGDEALRGVAAALKDTLGDRHLVCRQGGDEFSVLLQGVSRQEAVAVGRQVIEIFRRNSEGRTLQRFGSTLSIGIAMVEPQISSKELLARADLALYAAKRAGKSRCRLYRSDNEELARIRSDADWSLRIREGMPAGRFRMFYQPIVDLKTREIACHEALLRYVDHDGTLHPPADFLPAAERYYLMADVDRCVIGMVLNDLKRHPALRASVNLSGQSIVETSLGNFIIQAFAQSGVDPARVRFEITETVFIKELNNAVALIEELRERGCHFSLDDFGSGFSSLNYLRRLPVNVVKIDGAFVKRIRKDALELALLRSINEIAHMLGKSTIAEYVSSEEVCEILLGIGVDYGQGFYLGKPLPVENAMMVKCQREGPAPILPGSVVA